MTPVRLGGRRRGRGEGSHSGESQGRGRGESGEGNRRTLLVAAVKNGIIDRESSSCFR